MNDIDPKNIQPFLRICIILFLVMAVYAVIGIKLWHIQVLSGNKYTAKTSRQYARKIRIPAVRGRIFSSDGNLLAENRASYDVVFHLSEMRKPGRMSKTVNHIMGELARVSDSLGRRCEVTVMDIRHHMNYYPGLPITVFKDLTPAELAKVSELTPVVEGMEVTVETARHYPYGSLASHLIGYVGPSDPSKANDRNEFFYYIPDTIGKSGVESLYDDKLKGSPGKKLVLVNHRGFVHEVVGVPIPARNGFDLELTIDSRAQYLAERLLGDSNGAIVLLDASDGAVLAMASTPGFDPNLFVPRISSAEYSKLLKNPDKPFLNKAAQGSYMPGSIAKPLVGISMLENGISPDHKIVCDGFTMIGTSRIRCWIWYAGGHGPVDLLRRLLHRKRDATRRRQTFRDIRLRRNRQQDGVPAVRIRRAPAVEKSEQPSLERLRYGARLHRAGQNRSDTASGGALYGCHSQRWHALEAVSPQNAAFHRFRRHSDNGSGSQRKACGKSAHTGTDPAGNAPRGQRPRRRSQTGA